MLQNRKRYLAIVLLTTFVQRCVNSKGCTDSYPLVSGFHFSVLDYQMWANSNDTTSYSGGTFGENSDSEMLISYEGRIGADHYRGWCSKINETEQSFLQIDFKREVVIQQVETQGLLLLGYPTVRYIKGFWLEYSTDTATSFINVTQPNSNVTMMFSGQHDDNHTAAASVIQNLPQPISARIVRIYPNESVPTNTACLKVELHGCVPQREEECRSVYPLSCCSYGQPGDMISNVSVTSEDPEDSVPGPITDILSFYNKSRFWCSDREVLPASATFYFIEEVLLTSVAYHGLDGENADDYVTQYSWEYSVANSTVQTYTDLGDNTILENNREDKFQQTFWTPIHVETLKFVAHNKSIRPCIAFQFFGCKLSEVISLSQMAYVSTATSNSVVSTNLFGPQFSTVTETLTVTPAATMTSVLTATSTTTPIKAPTPSPKVTRCIGNEEPLISGIHYYVANNQLSASGHDPLRYTYDNMNERVLLTPEEGRIGNDYGSFIGWCSQQITNIMKNAPYIQVDFDTQVMVSAVAVQGFEINSDRRQPRYVREFQLAYKDLESEEFCIVNDVNGHKMNFTGNSDTNYLKESKSYLNKQIRAKVFRLYPKQWTSKAFVDNEMIDVDRACFKWELYGCAELNTVNNSCHLNQNLLSSSNVNVTSNSHDAVLRTSLFRLIDSNDHWCPSTEDIELPLFIDFYFAEATLLSSVAIAGRKNNDIDFFVSSYLLSYTSSSSCNLTVVEGLTGQSIFYNNHVRTFIHSFWKPIYVQQLRLTILDWYIKPCLSVGFFGCSSSDVSLDFTSSSETTGGLPQNVCNAPADNILLSCVNETSDSNNDVITIVIFVLLLLLASLLLVIALVFLYKRFKKRIRLNSFYPGNFMRSENLSNQGTINDDRPHHYSKLQHNLRNEGNLSPSPYNLLHPRQTQSYAQEGPRSVTYEEIPYHEITSKSN